MFNARVKSDFLKIQLLLILMLGFANCYSQKQDRVWCFGDSTGIDFNNLANPSIITSGITALDSGSISLNAYSSLSNASICDTSGNLLFYASGLYYAAKGVVVFNANHSLMAGGDSVEGHPGFDQGCLIIPRPNHSHIYYLLTLGLNAAFDINLYYSVIDMSLNGGLGGIVSKNDTIIAFDALSQKMNAVRHANGRDWWVITTSVTGNAIYKTLITPSGFSTVLAQHIGTGGIDEKVGQTAFSRDGSMFVSVSPRAAVDILNFDRCSGDFSNFQDIGEHIFSGVYENQYRGCAFSPDGSKLYVSTYNITSRNVYQYDLDSTNISATKQIVFSYPDTPNTYYSFSHQMLGPDNKIYVIKSIGGGPLANNWYDQNIDVILQPDSPASSCGYSPNYFSLDGHWTAGGFPNIPNFNLGRIAGSICDSIWIGLENLELPRKGLDLIPNPSHGIFTINLIDDTDNILELKVTNVMGVQLLSSRKYHSYVDISDMPPGVYYVQVYTRKGKLLVGKIVKDQ